MSANLPPGLRDRLSPLIYLSNNWISRIGVFLVTAASVFWLFMLPTYLQGHSGASAYIGILLYLALPTLFFAGLACIPVGIIIKKKQLGPNAPMREAIGIASLNWQNPDFRKFVTFIGLATGANVVIAANLSYRAVEHMDSVQFCGQTCHVVMKPEFNAYQNSPHSKVECVQCHIGPGASWFVQSKLSGLHQVFAVAFNTYERPIPVPVANLRPARETCEGCHWPDKYGGDKLRIIPHYTDEGQLTQSVLLMRIGGGNIPGSGIHTRHVGKGIKIRYAHTDRARQTIPWVEYSVRDAAKREYFAEKTTPADVSKMQIREMDCVDCHNRPSHATELPERATDNAMAAGNIVPTIPGVRKVALEVLKKEYTSTAQAEAEIPVAVKKALAGKASDAEVERSAKGVLSIWQRNIFPEMKITWGTYFNNIGHNDYPGCFRCHDEKHKTQDGAKAISQDCNACHVMLAMEEANPKILKDLGMSN